MSPVAILMLGPSGLDAARRARDALIAAGVDAELHGSARRFADSLAGLDALFADTGEHLRALYRGGRPIVGVCSAGILIRLLAPCLDDKTAEPAVIALAEDGSAVVPLLGAHRGGLGIARTIAGAFGVAAAVTTAGDLRLGVALDDPPEGWRLADPAAAKEVTAALLAGAAAEADPALDWLAHLPATGPGTPVTLAASIRPAAPAPRTLTYHPRRLALGVGCERGCAPEHLIAHATAVLAAHDLAPEAVACVVSLDRKADEPAVHALAAHLDAPARFFSAEQLAAVASRVPNPSEVVRAAVGTASVAEAAALAAAGPDGVLIAPKAKSAKATAALAAAPRPIAPESVGRARGHLAVVGIGPGGPAWRTAEAVALLRAAEEWVGYRRYLDLVGDLHTRQTRHAFPLGAEEQRVRFALEKASAGRRVALVSSGDPGVYAMGALVFEMLAAVPPVVSDDARRVEIEVAPGVSAAQAAAARLGAPLGHDFCCISLSDLLTPWEVIERRLEAAASADFAVALYNPRSGRRRWQLGRAVAALSAARPAGTPVAIASNVGRPDERIALTTLEKFDADAVDMLSLVLVGASTTRAATGAGGRPFVYTPRGYAAKAKRSAA